MLPSDPWFTLSQIGIIQTSYYLLLGLLLSSLHILFDHTHPLSLQLLFASNGLGSTGEKLTAFFAQALLIPLMIIVFVYVVDHASKVLDFVLTMYALHMILCLVFSLHLPRAPLWWGMAVFQGTVLTVLAEIACSSRDAADLERFNTHMQQEGGRAGGSGVSGDGVSADGSQTVAVSSAVPKSSFSVVSIPPVGNWASEFK